MKHAPFLRSLSILRGLQQSPKNRDELIAFVHDDLDASVYAAQPDVQRKRIENDLARLRELGAQVDFRAGRYCLDVVGDFARLTLPDSALDTLAFLEETFAPGAPNREAVQQLLRLLSDRLSPRQRAELSKRRQQLRVDLRRRDDDDIAAVVQTTIERALHQHRHLQFAYRSPGQRDGLPRTHTVQPWQIFFDTTRRHLYLKAYWLRSRGPHGEFSMDRWQNFRLGRILAEGIAILPNRLPPEPPPPTRYRLEYLLGPDIARLGEISHHFTAMEVGQPDADGWVRVIATTDDLFHALRLLLGYGPNCKVVGGPEAQREMRALVEATAELYLE